MIIAFTMRMITVTLLSLVIILAFAVGSSFKLAKTAAGTRRKSSMAKAETVLAGQSSGLYGVGFAGIHHES